MRREPTVVSVELDLSTPLQTKERVASVLVICDFHIIAKNID